jgi:hypothetical protein
MARETMQIKERLYSKSARILGGWSTDPRFTASGGSPLDLPLERNKQRRSFEDLVDKYAPGNHPGTVLKELKRRGNVELLDGEVVRFKSANTQARGMTPATVSKAALRMNRLGKTLFQKILDPEAMRLYEETGKMTISARQMAIIRPVLEERTRSFIKSIESEFALAASEIPMIPRALALAYSRGTKVDSELLDMGEVVARGCRQVRVQRHPILHLYLGASSRASWRRLRRYRILARPSAIGGANLEAIPALQFPRLQFDAKRSTW